MSDLKVIPIKSSDTYNWLLKKHYAKRIPNITDSFGLFDKSNLIGVITYGLPPSPSLCEGVCGKEHSSKVIELNRLCLQDNFKNQSSILISKSLRMLPKPKIVISYADTSQGHVGYVYQATNFIYTGLSAKRTDVDTGGKHARHSKGFDPKKRIDRPRKHRYIYFAANKTDKKILKKCLNYKTHPYPKGDTSNYDSGDKVLTQMILDI